MANSSGNARWYLAEIVTEVKILGSSERVVHNNLILIRANSPEEAYQKSLARGKGMEDTYENDGQELTVTFRGLSDLNIIQDELEDGAEIAYEEMLDMSEADIRDMLSTKEELGVFHSDEDDEHNHGHSHGKDYESQHILDEAMRIINHKDHDDHK
ncbi:MAG TPA: DUF4288 domain-containing protein [Dictyobacter sp.]|jgi:hypothetical protein|nr:DUF4288 domain-containing protein [Dictyobacter sp.]